MTSVSVVIPFRSDGPERNALYRWCLARWDALHPEAEIITTHDDRIDGPFCRSRAVNRGAEMASGDVLVIADADIAVRHGQVAAGLERLDAGATWVLPYRRMVHLTGSWTLAVLAASPWFDLPDRVHAEAVRFQSTASVCGMVMIRRDDYRAIGGNDERFMSWGHEDVAFAMKADTLLGDVHRTDGDVVHLYHDLRADRKTDTHARANRDLGRQYERAAGDPEAMTALVRQALA